MHKSIRCFAATVLAALVVCVTGCNTVKGFGQDMQSGGQAVEKAAVDAKN